MKKVKISSPVGPTSIITNNADNNSFSRLGNNPVTNQHQGISINAQKRSRTGSISGRLRTASDLEESGMIDRYQKGVIKDMIISGDINLTAVLDKYEKGDTKDLEELIRSGCFSRRQSIDLLDGLDFDFLNGLHTEEDVSRVFEEDFLFDSLDLTTALTHPLNLGINGPGNSSLLPIGSIDDMSESFKNNPLLFFPHFSSNRRPSFDSSSYHISPYEDEDIDFDAADDDICSSFIQDVFSLSHSHSGDLMHPDDFTHNLEGFSDRYGQHQLQNNSSSIVDGISDLHHTGGEVELSAYEKLAVTLQQQQQQKQGGGGGGWHQQQQQQQQSITEQYMSSSSIANDEQQQSHSSSMGLKRVSSSTTPVLISSSSLLYNNNNNNNNNNISSHHHLLSGEQTSFLGSTPVNIYTSSSSSNMFPDHMTHLHQSSPSLKHSSDLPIVYGGEGFVGAYSPEQRRLRIEKFFEKRTKRVWTKKVKYDVRKNFADSRVRVKGRFVKKEEEEVPTSSLITTTTMIIPCNNEINNNIKQEYSTQEYLNT